MKLIVIIFVIMGNVKCYSSSFINTYYTEISYAQKLLIENKEDSSCKMFVKIFEESDLFYINDFVLPLQVCIKRNDTSNYTKLIKLLKTKGNYIKTIENVFNHNKISKDSFWSCYFHLNKNSSENKICSYKTIVDSLFIKDQEDRKIAYSTFFLFRKKKINDWDKNSLIRLKYFFKEVNVLDEHLLGLNNSQLYHDKIYTIFYHYPIAFTKFKNELTKYLINGELHPRHYAWIEEFESRHKNKLKRQRKCAFNYGFFLLDCPHSHSLLWDVKSKKSINENRLKIDLPSYEHDLKLFNYIKRNNYLFSVSKY